MTTKKFTLKNVLMVFLLAGSSYSYAQQSISGSFESAGQTRSYLGAIPESPQTPLRLVILFCGATENAAQMELRGFNNFLSNNTMVIYPEPFNITFGFDNSAGVDDFQMVEDLISTISSEYTINLNDICIGGFSNGGIFTYSLVCEFNSPESTRPYSFKSFAIVSGAMGSGLANSTDCPVADDLPAIFFHGTQDPVIAYAGGNIPPPVSMLSEATETTIAYWVNEVNGCFSDPEMTTLPDAVTETPVASTVELLEYSCSSSPGSRFYRILGGQHAWPGGNANFDMLQSRNMDINASELIAEFFESSPPLSTSENRLDPNSISVYPNPVAEMLFIETTHSLQRIEIFNITGQQVLSVVSPRPSIELEDFVTGIYLVKIETEAGTDVKKIVKR
jgi:polyhydroxybutyrate depolymerase